MKGCDFTMQKSNIMLLRERMQGNYADYRRQMLELCGECIFEFAAEIAAVREAYNYIMTYEWTQDELAHLLLKFDNPLRIVVDEWRGYQQANNPGFESFAFEFTMDFLSDDIIILSDEVLDYVEEAAGRGPYSEME